MIVKFTLAIIFTEAITEIITKSELFSPIRTRVFKKAKDNKVFDWLHSLLDCGYCFSVWSGFFVAIVFFRDVGLIHPSIDWFFVAIVLHRLSNMFHNILDRIHGI